MLPLIECPLHSYRSQSRKFFSTDTLENYNTTVKKVSNWDWANTDILYDFNELGYRSDPITTGKHFLALGCSHTVGVGLPKTETFSYLISKKLKLQCVNGAINSGTNEMILMNLTRWLNYAKPEFVLIQWTYPTRKMFFYNGVIHSNLEEYTRKQCVLPDSYEDYLDHYDDIKHYFNEIRNQCKVLCKLSNTKLIEFKVENIGPIKDFNNIKTIKTDIGWEDGNKILKSDFLARDNMHPGRLFQREVTEFVVQQ